MKWGFILVTLYTGPLVMMGRDMRAMVPSELLFWGVMSLGVIAGFAVAYPANVWLVAHHLKHGLMTERSPQGHPPRRHRITRPATRRTPSMWDPASDSTSSGARGTLADGPFTATSVTTPRTTTWRCRKAAG